MSIKVMDMVGDRQLPSSTEKQVLMSMANYASDCGNGIWASNQTVGDRIGVKRETVSRNISKLLSSGVIEKVGKRKPYPQSKHWTVVYKIRLDILVSLPMTKTAIAHQELMRKQSVTENHNVIERCDYDAVNDVTGNHTNRPIEPSLKDISKDILKKQDRRKQRLFLDEHWRPSTPRKGTKLSQLLPTLTPQEVEDEIEKFKNYHIGKQSKSADFDRQFSTWIINYCNWNSKSSGTSRGTRSNRNEPQTKGFAGALERRVKERLGREDSGVQIDADFQHRESEGQLRLIPDGSD